MSGKLFVSCSRSPITSFADALTPRGNDAGSLTKTSRRTCSMHKTKENPRNPYPFPAPACSDLFRQDGRSCINEEAKRPGVVVAALHAVRAPCTELLLGREVRSEIDGACRCSRRAARAADPGRLRGGGGAHLQCNPRSVPAAS